MIPRLAQTLGLGLVLAAAKPAAAQDSAVRWSLSGLQIGICIEFLVSPDSLSGSPFFGMDFRVASTEDALSPALTAAVNADPSLRSWYPSQLCLLQLRSTEAAGRRARDEREPQGVALWVMGGASDAARRGMIFTTHSSLRRAGRLERVVEMAAFETALDADRETGALQAEAKFGDTQVFWRAPGGALTPVAAPGRLALVVPLAPSGAYILSLAVDGATRYGGPTSLQVLGTGILARVLGASPIRWVGGVWRDGDGQAFIDR